MRRIVASASAVGNRTETAAVVRDESDAFLRTRIDDLCADIAQLREQARSHATKMSNAESAIERLKEQTQSQKKIIASLLNAQTQPRNKK